MSKQNADFFPMFFFSYFLKTSCSGCSGRRTCGDSHLGVNHDHPSQTDKLSKSAEFARRNHEYSFRRVPPHGFAPSRVKQIIVSVVREREGVEGVVVRGSVVVGGEGDRPVSLLDGLQCSVTLFSRTEDCSLVHSK